MATTSSLNTTTSLVERLVGFKETLAARYAKYTIYRNTLAELQSLSSRELADLGLSRSNIKSVAYEATYTN